MRRLWIFLLVLSFTGLLGGEPLHALFHDVTGVEHVQADADATSCPSFAAPDFSCGFLEAWVSLISIPTLSDRQKPAPDFALESLEPDPELVVRPFTRPVDLPTRPRGPPSRG